MNRQRVQNVPQRGPVVSNMRFRSEGQTGLKAVPTWGWVLIVAIVVALIVLAVYMMKKRSARMSYGRHRFGFMFY